MAGESYLSKPQKFLVRPAPGWIPVTLEELKLVLASPSQKYKFSPKLTVEDGIIFLENTDYRQAMEVVSRLSTAYDVEWVLHSARVSSRAGWSEYFKKSNLDKIWREPKGLKLSLSVQVTHPVVGTAKDVKKYALDFLEPCAINVLDSTSRESLDAKVRIESQKNRARILISMAGEPLYKRGYKNELSNAVAPLPEHHAAACYYWSAYRLGYEVQDAMRSGEMPFVVPFAGSGTLGFESFCRLLNIAPGLMRGQYAFEHFSFNPEKTLATIKRRLMAQVMNGDVRLLFGDVDAGVCKTLDKNILGFQNRIKGLAKDSSEDNDREIRLSGSLKENNFLKDSLGLIGKEERVFLALNPPYGDRLAKKTGADSIYRDLGRVIKDLSQRTIVCGFVLCGSESSWGVFLKQIDSFKTKTTHFTHGGIDLRVVVFSSKKTLASS